MNFQDLQYHLEGYGCNLDHLIEECYHVTNCINGEVCLIEKLDVYAEFTLCHYFQELGVPAPDDMREAFERYRNFRETVGKIAAAEEEDE